MSAIQKEQIYVELRKYHLDEFPDSLANPEMNDLLEQYRVLEDKAVSMLLGLVNGKAEFVDLSQDFKAFEKLIKSATSGGGNDADKEHFSAKLAGLKEIMDMAQRASFTLRPMRKIRQPTREVITKVNKK